MPKSWAVLNSESLVKSVISVLTVPESFSPVCAKSNALTRAPIHEIGRVPLPAIHGYQFQNARQNHCRSVTGPVSSRRFPYFKAVFMKPVHRVPQSIFGALNSHRAVAVRPSVARFCACPHPALQTSRITFNLDFYRHFVCVPLYQGCTQCSGRQIF